jgi:hypothetical protein
MKKSVKTVVKYFLNIMPESINRLIISYVYNRDFFKLKSSADVFTDIYNTDLWNTPESKSGRGSTLEATFTIRQQLPIIISKYSISTMLDVPCGDYNWMKEVQKDCNYLGGDIVAEVVEKNQQLYSSETVQFKQIDITTDILPKVDLIFCKDCLQHLSYDKVKDALNNFKRSGSTYLLVTSYPKTWRNHDIYDGDYRALNLLIKPFYLANYILKIKEESKSEGIEVDKTMYLYNLKSIGN